MINSVLSKKWGKSSSNTKEPLFKIWLVHAEYLRETLGPLWSQFEVRTLSLWGVSSSDRILFDHWILPDFREKCHRGAQKWPRKVKIWQLGFLNMRNRMEMLPNFESPKIAPKTQNLKWPYTFCTQCISLKEPSHDFFDFTLFNRYFDDNFGGVKENL